MDLLFIILGVELVIGVIAALGGGPFGLEWVVKVFVGTNVVAAVLALAIWLLTMGLT